MKAESLKVLRQTDVISCEAIKSCLDTSWAGKRLEYYDETDSTNTRAKVLGQNGTPHGTLVVAEKQNAGRGRRGRRWDSPAGSSIYMSLLLRPRFAPVKAPMLTLVMAYAVAQTLREKNHVPVGIKWPNDLVLNKKKICGILTEMSAEKEDINYVVIGVGINVNTESFLEEINNTATSLRIETGEVVKRAELIAGIMKYFELYYEQFCEAEDLSPFVDGYNKLLVNCGQQVRVLEPGNEYNALAFGIDKKGELQVEREDGRRESIFAGEVSVRGIYGYV